MKRTRRPSNTLSVAVDPAPYPGCCETRDVLPQQTTWRNAIDWLASPAFRVHRYRNTHTRMLRSAMCTVDCGSISNGRDADNDNDSE